MSSLHSPLLSSQYLGWKGIIAEYHKHPAQKIDKHCQLYHVIEVNFYLQSKILRCWNQNCSFKNLRRGDFNIIPAQIMTEVSWESENEYLLLYLHPMYLAEIASELVDATSIEIEPQFAIRDPAIYNLALLFKSELESQKNCDRLYIDSLTDTLIIHLLRRYSTQKYLPQKYGDGLSKNKLQEIIKYIETHLTEDLSLQQLAQVLHLNPHYFTSLFKQSMGMSAYQYVITRRIETAKRLLQQQDLPIIEIAYCTGFRSSSHFSNTFRKHIGVTPSAYRKAMK
ncbi:MAG: helix-turn-helix domain-containing protein [Waterburya sp.]